MIESNCPDNLLLADFLRRMLRVTVNNCPDNLLLADFLRRMLRAIVNNCPDNLLLAYEPGGLLPSALDVNLHLSCCSVSLAGWLVGLSSLGAVAGGLTASLPQCCTGWLAGVTRWWGSCLLAALFTCPSAYCWVVPAASAS